jgi:hypothetical protein
MSARPGKTLERRRLALVFHRARRRHALPGLIAYLDFHFVPGRGLGYFMTAEEHRCEARL